MLRLKPRWQQVGRENFTQFERVVLLQSFDSNWRDHLSALDYLRQGIHLRGYAPRSSPSRNTSAKRSSCSASCSIRSRTKSPRSDDGAGAVLSAQLDQAAQSWSPREHITNVTYTAPTETGEAETTVDDAGGAIDAAAFEGVRVGRNDPCPCGSGKKYKQCHGKLA
jgi:preprotein translocase subunit SecA